MAKQLCQSCTLPLNDTNKGNESDGSKSQKYCSMCYENGQFTWTRLSVEKNADGKLTGNIEIPGGKTTRYTNIQWLWMGL